MRVTAHPDLDIANAERSSSRRAVIRGLPALVPMVTVLADRQDVRAGNRKKKKRRCCNNGTQRCQGECRDLRTDNATCGTRGHACEAGDTCFGGLCLTGAGTCAPTSCSGAVTACNGVPFCYCRASISGGTRCGMAPPDGAITCGTCRSDGECIARYGHGAFCSDCCGGRGGCAVPCPG